MIGHGVKEGLVERVADWSGIHSAKARLLGEPLTGHWFSRKDEYAARRRGEDFGSLEYATEETVVLSPIPCWEHLPAEEEDSFPAASSLAPTPSCGGKRSYGRD